MPQHPFPEPGPDSEEAASSPPPPAAEGEWEDWAGPAEQGLYMCLPPEQLTLAGFAQGGEADTMTPGPLLATVVHTVTGQDGSGLAGCSDEQLMGIIAAARRMEARAAWTQMAAVAQYAARHAGARPADEFAPVELGFELHVTPQSAAEQMQFSSAVAARLPATFAALVTLTIPWATYQGRSETPGEAGGFGLLNGDDARDLAAAAARHPRTRWCLTALNPDGTAAAHACLPGRHPPPGLADPIAVGGPAPPPTTPLIPVARGPCDHAHAEVGYHPSRKLQHLIRARSATCTAPGCSRPAARCDLDHSVPWDQGGLTCECDLAPLCRRHHRCKQAEGWQLTQPEPGVLIWRVPSGRSYTTTPTEYPI
jgi:hypothetical protein